MSRGLKCPTPPLIQRLDRPDCHPVIQKLFAKPRKLHDRQQRLERERENAVNKSRYRDASGHSQNDSIAFPRQNDGINGMENCNLALCGYRRAGDTVTMTKKVV